MVERLSREDYDRLRSSLGESLNIYQATIAMISIFIGFVFAGLLGILLTEESLTGNKVVLLWTLTLSMVCLTFSLILMHATAHRVFKYWGIFYPISVFNRFGSLFLNAGLLLMFASISVLFLGHSQFILAGLVILAGISIVVFGVRFRSMHRGQPHFVNIDEPSPYVPQNTSTS